MGRRLLSDLDKQNLHVLVFFVTVIGFIRNWENEYQYVLHIDLLLNNYQGGYIKHESSCLITFSNTKKRVKSKTHSSIFFDKLQGVWNCGQTLS